MFKRNKLVKKLNKQLQTLEGKNGVNYLRALLIGELNRDTFSINEKEENERMAKILRNNDSISLNNYINTLSKQREDIYNQVINIYPMVIRNLISLLDETEHLAELHTRSALMGIVKEPSNIEEWKEVLNSPYKRLEHLYFSFPYELENIFGVFNESLLDDRIYQDIYAQGKMDSLISLITAPGDHQQFFKRELNYFIKTCDNVS